MRSVRLRRRAVSATTLSLGIFFCGRLANAQASAPWGLSPDAPAGTPTIPVAGAPTPTLLQPYPGAVPVHVESDGDPLAVSVPIAAAVPRTLLRPVEATGFGDPSAPRMRVCQTPCTLYLSRGPFRVVIGGDGRRETTDTFLVGDRESWVQYRSASRAGYAFGQFLVWTGGGALVAGALTLGTELQHASPHDVTGPALALVFGAVATGIGIPVLLYNRVGRIRDRARDRVAVHVAMGMSHDGTATAGLSAAF